MTYVPFYSETLQTLHGHCPRRFYSRSQSSRQPRDSNTTVCHRVCEIEITTRTDPGRKPSLRHVDVNRVKQNHLNVFFLRRGTRGDPYA